MSRCAYYSCFKGQPSCSHPEKGKYTDFKRTGAKYNPCDRCKRNGGGLYPSQIPKADQSNWEYDVVDRNGDVIS